MADKGTMVNLTDKQAYTIILEKLSEHYSDSAFRVPQLAAALSIGERQLLRRINDIFGFGSSELLRNYRLVRAEAKLLAGHPASYAAYDSGFTSPTYFSTSFKQFYGCSPSEFIKMPQAPEAVQHFKRQINLI